MGPSFYGTMRLLYCLRLRFRYCFHPAVMADPGERAADDPALRHYFKSGYPIAFDDFPDATSRFWPRCWL
jgi:hypothetical protein